MSDNQWIPVGKQMPAEDVRCIIATRIPGRYVRDGQVEDGHELEFGEWAGNRWRCFCHPVPCLMHPSMVSHWMALPETPQETT